MTILPTIVIAVAVLTLALGSLGTSRRVTALTTRVDRLEHPGPAPDPAPRPRVTPGRIDADRWRNGHWHH